MITKTTADSSMPQFMVYPKYLIKAPLSETTKLVYMMLLDRTRLSMQSSGYTDKQGNIFIYYPIAELARDIGKSEMTVKKSLSALEQIELILRVRQGPGQANRIYVSCEAPEAVTDKKQSVSHRQKNTPEKDKTVSTKEKASDTVKGQDNVLITDSMVSGSNNKNNNETNNNEKLRMNKVIRRTYGKYQNVKLTDDEYCRLKQYRQCNEYIERLSDYMFRKNRSYGDHAGTIERWINQDHPQAPQRSYDCREDESL